MVHFSDPIQIGPLWLKNRFVVAATFSNNTIETDFVGPHLLNAYKREGRGGAAMVIVQAAYVHPQGRGGFRRRLGIHEDRCINSLEELSSIIKRGGAKAAIQLQHARFHSKGDKTPGGASSDFASFSEDQIQIAIKAFGLAAGRSKAAGFDAVEIHSCHGSLPAQFLSSLINRRSDKWGDDPTLFPISVLRSVRDAVGPDFPVIVRLSAEEGVEGGFTIHETVARVPLFEKNGASVIHVSSGSRSGLAARAQEVGPLYFPVGHLAKHAKAVKQVVGIPVIAVGKIMSPELAQSVLDKGWADLIALSRPIIADPDFPGKAIKGKTDEIRPCIGCNYCYRRVAFDQLAIRCAVNPERGREGLYPLRPADGKKQVMVIGGGPAGMEAAITLAKRGHAVTLHEKTNRLGGQVRLAAKIPFLLTRNLGRIIQFHESELKRLGVNVFLNEAIIPESVINRNPDAVVVATGATFRPPNFSENQSLKILAVEDCLSNSSALDQKVVVIGGRHGAEPAVSLARRGCQVMLVHEGDEDDIGRPEYIHDEKRTFFLRRYLNEENVAVLTRTHVVAWNVSGVRVQISDGSLLSLEADAILWAVGRMPNDSLATGLKQRFKGDVFVIGDCASPRSIVEAIDDGAYIGKEIQTVGPMEKYR